MENAISTINLMPSTSQDVSKMYLLIKQEILSGVENPLKLEVQLKAMEELIKKLRSDNDIKDNSMSEVMKYPDNNFEIYGAKFTKMTAGVKYDFSDCNDSEYIELKEKEKELKAKIKSKETFLKSLEKEMVNPDTGELISPPIKTGKETFSVKLM